MKKYIVFVGILFSIYFFNIKFEQITYIPKSKVEKKSKEINSKIGVEKTDKLIETIYNEFPDFEKISPKQRLELYNILNYLYLESTNYAKTSEINLKKIKLAKKLKNDDAYIKSHIELALLFGRIGGNESGIQLLKKIENINLPNKYENADKKVYALFNLFELYVRTNNFQEAENSIAKINQYQKDFPADDWRDIEILVNNDYAKIYMHKGDYAKAKQCLDKSLSLQKLDNNEYYEKKDIPYKFNLAQYYVETNQIAKGKEVYYQLLQLANKNNDNYFKLKVLNKLEKIEDDKNKKIKLLDEILVLTEKENNAMYNNYTKSITTLIDYELNIMEQYQLKNKIYRLVISLLLVLGYGIFYIQKMKTKSENDGMTSVFNRRKYDEDFEKSKFWNKCGVIVIDIDNFKILNDTYGHLFGDEVLIANAKLLKNLCKKQKGAKVYRYGGEEFIILCKNMSFDNVVAFAEKIRTEIASKSWDNQLQVTVSIGVSHSDNTSRKNLFEKADTNLYISKKEGKNRVTSI